MDPMIHHGLDALCDSSRLGIAVISDREISFREREWMFHIRYHVLGDLSQLIMPE
jgi:hypothetical protein